MPEAVSLLLALVCTGAIVTLFPWPLWVTPRRARRAAIARFVEAIDGGDFPRADAAAACLLDRHGRSPRHSAG